MMRNAFLYCIFVYVQKRFDKKAMVNFKLYDVTGWITNLCNIQLPKISRSNGNQTREMGQLIECKIRNIFLEKSYTKYGGEASPRPFYKKTKSSISLNQQTEML